MSGGAPKSAHLARPTQPPRREVDRLLDSLDSLGHPEARIEVVTKIRAVVDSIADDLHAALIALGHPGCREEWKP